MDSLTQAVLGATVGYAIGGKQLGRKAAVWGAVAGTLPDLDVFVRHFDPVDDFVNHRSWSHSLLLISLASPPLGWLISRVHSAAREYGARMIGMVFAVLLTHILLDGLTTYGTQIFWFLSDYLPFLPQDPIGIGSVAIVDPLYTVPLIIATVWILIRGRERPDGSATLSYRATIAALAFSTLYLGWGLAAQQYVKSTAATQLEARNIKADALFATPTFGNSLLWYILVREGDQIHYGVHSLLDPKDQPLQLTSMTRNSLSLSDLPNTKNAEKVVSFSKGFYRISEQNKQMIISDLRMGFAPTFVFNFAIANRQGVSESWQTLEPTRQIASQVGTGLIGYVWRRIFDPAASRS